MVLHRTEVAVGAPQDRERATMARPAGQTQTISEHTMKRYAIAALALSLFAAGAQAQKPRRPVPQTEGFMLGGTTVLAAGITISGPEVQQDIKTSMGQGVGVQVGYGFTPRLMGFASGTIVKQNSNYGPFDGSFGLALLEVAPAAASSTR